MKIDDYGTCIFEEQDIFNLLYQNITEFSNITVTQDINSFIEFTEQPINLYQPPTMSIEEFDRINKSNWFIPDEYISFDIYQYISDTCTTEDELIRCAEELELFNKLGMMPLFPLLKYIVDTLKANNVMYGVGRGSSTASYVLYKLGIHRIDSMKYELDYKEFLRQEIKNVKDI